MDERRAKKKRITKVTQQENAEEKSTLHSKYFFITFLAGFLVKIQSYSFFLVKDAYDYQGRSFLEAPHDLDVNLRSETAPSKCYIPKKQIHTWTGHTKGVQAIRWFPKTAHLLLSCGMDNKVKVSVDF